MEEEDAAVAAAGSESPVGVAVAAHLARLATVPPQGAAVEAAAWRLLEARCAAALDAYPRTLAHDAQVLAATAAAEAVAVPEAAAGPAAAAGASVAASAAEAAAETELGVADGGDGASARAVPLVRFSNAWNATVQVRGEKAVLAQWVRVARARAHAEDLAAAQEAGGVVEAAAVEAAATPLADAQQRQ